MQLTNVTQSHLEPRRSWVCWCMPLVSALGKQAGDLCEVSLVYIASSRSWELHSEILSQSKTTLQGRLHFHFCFSSARDWTQTLTHARQVFSYWATILDVKKDFDPSNNSLFLFKKQVKITTTKHYSYFAMQVDYCGLCLHPNNREAEAGVSGQIWLA